MKTKIIEATNGFNYGKFMLAAFDDEWSYRSALHTVDDAVPESKWSLIAERGWRKEHHWVLDLQTGEGAIFSLKPGGLARADLNKHRIWVCPLFEPFLAWLYQQDVGDLAELPAVVRLDAAQGELWGHRRPGPEPGGSEQV